ncbi:MAG: roadblock/LC7 domain-containing protein [Gemmatimonadota bacterium]
MKAPAPADLQRWSDDVARDPASLSFLPLARSYRKQGRRDAALRLCLRGLEQHPAHVEAHALLAMLYFEGGQRSKAYDEWSMVLRLEPENFEALRGMGFYHLEQGDDLSALRSLQRAVALRPSDLSVQEALKLIHDKNQAVAGAEAAPVRPESTLRAEADVLMPWEEPTPASVAAPAPAAATAPPPLPPEPARAHPAPPPAFMPPRVPVAEVPRPGPAFVPTQYTPAPPAHVQAPPQQRHVQYPPAPTRPPAQPQSPPAAPAPELPLDPSRLFESVVKGQILGALLLDSQGLVLAGSLSGETGNRAETLGALLGGAIEEAARTANHLSLGNWNGILLESDHALLHLAPVSTDTILLIAARRDTPPGWMLRSAHQANALAARFLEVYA